ncbi:MAG TPA: hypothetical protein VGF59_19945 [Bryobacteraceae bacterium]
MTEKRGRGPRTGAGGRWLAALAVFWTACSPAPPAAPKSTAGQTSPKITQFYATVPKIAPGEKALLCYGVENAKTVWLSPPRHELSAALSRCVEVTPSATTTYTLTAEGASGPPATSEATITLGSPKVHIVEVAVNSLSISRGMPVSICYQVQNARSVRIEPLGYSGGTRGKGCAGDHPQKTTTYTVVATGAEGDRDEEKVTVKVQ